MSDDQKITLDAAWTALDDMRGQLSMLYSWAPENALDTLRDMLRACNRLSDALNAIDNARSGKKKEEPV